MNARLEHVDKDHRTRAHDESVRSNPADITAFLLELFGESLVAHMAGVADKKRVHKWIAGEGISSTSESRLRSAYQVAWRLLDQDAAETVRAWFIGMNPQLEYEAPADLIRDDRHREVMVAVDAFLDGA